MNTNLVRLGNLVKSRPVVEPLMRMRPKMPEPIPLRAALRVEAERVVMYDPVPFAPDLVLQGLATEAWGFQVSELEIDRNAPSVLDLAGRLCGVLWGEEVELT